METKYEKFIKKMRGDKNLLEREEQFTEEQKIEEMASYNRLLKFLKEKDVVIMSASRDENDTQENKRRNSILRAELIKRGYGITKIKGGYVQNPDGGTYDTKDKEQNIKNGNAVYEDSVFVVNLNNDEDFFDVMKGYGKKFNQDSILISDVDELDAYYFDISTNSKSDVDFEDITNKVSAEDQYFSKIKNRRFKLYDNDTKADTPDEIEHKNRTKLKQEIKYENMVTWDSLSIMDKSYYDNILKNSNI